MSASGFMYRRGLVCYLGKIQKQFPVHSAFEIFYHVGHFLLIFAEYTRVNDVVPPGIQAALGGQGSQEEGGVCR